MSIWDVARVDAAFLVVDDDIDGDAIELVHLAFNGQHIKFFHLTGCIADAPTEECIQFDVSFLACLMDAGDVESLGQRYHRHRGAHPQIKGGCTGGILGIYFFHIFFLSCVRYANIRKNFRLKSYTGENIIVLAL